MRPLMIGLAMLLVMTGPAGAQTYRDDAPVLVPGPTGQAVIAEVEVTTPGGPVGVWAAWVHDAGNQLGEAWLTGYAYLLRSDPAQPDGAGAVADSRWLPSAAPGTRVVESVSWTTVDAPAAGAYRYTLVVGLSAAPNAYLAASVVRLIVWPLGSP